MSANGAKIINLDALKDALWPTFVNAFVYIRHPFLTYFAMCERTGLPNPACPQHVFDKFLWRKVFDRDPSSVAMSDKLVAKTIACDLCPSVKVPRTLWVGERFEDIPPELIAGDAVVKTSHGSGFFRRTWFLDQPHPGWRGAYARWLRSRIDRMVAQPDA